MYDVQVKAMADPEVASVAFERAWNVYLLINKGVDENDERCAILDRFIRKRCEADVADKELLVVEGLKYLKRLDQSEPGLPE
jgi:hypothetical protein